MTPAWVISNGRGVGVARYLRDAHDPHAAEIAVTTVDDWQGRGLGTELTTQRPIVGRSETGGGGAADSFTTVSDRIARHGNHAVERASAEAGFARRWPAPRGESLRSPGMR
jgi:hypothetical protein